MNFQFKKEFLSYEIPSVMITGSVALMHYGYNHTNNDVDAFTYGIYRNHLIERGFVPTIQWKTKQVYKSPCGHVDVAVIRPNLYIHPNCTWKELLANCNQFDGYQIEGLSTLLKFYMAMNRPKDQDKIEWLMQQL